MKNSLTHDLKPTALPYLARDGKTRASYELVNRLTGKAVASLTLIDGNVTKLHTYPSEVNSEEFIADAREHFNANKPNQ